MTFRQTPIILAVALCLISGAASKSSYAEQVPPPVRMESGKLVYKQGTTGREILDFSTAGYRAGADPLPHVAVKVVVSPAEGDDTDRIQQALDAVAVEPLNEYGLRGVVQLAPGEYQIDRSIRITASGVVLRGSGDRATTLIATGTDRRALLEIQGHGSREVASVTDVLAPSALGATRLKVADASAFAAGGRILIRHESTADWIRGLGMDSAPARSGFAWKPGTVDTVWEREITAVVGNELELDAPLTLAMDPSVGRVTVAATRWNGRIRNSGIENLRCVSAHDPARPGDEDHSWIAVRIASAEDCWVADVNAHHFSYAAVYVASTARRITVQDCAYLDPVSELAGYRRHAFYTAGQQCLFLRCRSEEGRNDFVTGYMTPGPNVFLECAAVQSGGFSGSVGSWSTGLLFDNVQIDGGELRLDNMETWNQGVGWAAANSVIWQCQASRIICRTPPGATNWAVGVWGMVVGNGKWSQTSEFAEPDSLYRAQLEERIGKEKAAAVLARRRYPIEAPGSRAAANLSAPAPQNANNADGLRVANGWLVAADAVLVGKEQGLAWWRGNLNPERGAEVGPSLTRFVPGAEGVGQTDDLGDLVKSMEDRGAILVRHHWGLWYERRADDHQMVRRPDADAWPPFYEQPWQRSGVGRAWDGLSKYDLTKFNPWYFNRVRNFAALARKYRRLLVNEMYFQHNVLEAGAHWASFPWRPANAVQETGFPEPPEYAGDKRVFMAEAFYDVSHPVRRELHRAYIRQCLDNLRDEPNVVHTTGAEYSGPLHFVQFWIDVVGEWMRETGRRPIIALSAPKDVQDAILADPQRAAIVSVIDLTYWWRTDAGEFAPAGGQNLAPRQHERKWKGGRPSSASLAAMAREYRLRYPEKAVMSGLEQKDGWAFFAAGGSFPAVPPRTAEPLLRAVAELSPTTEELEAGVFAVGDGKRGYLIYLSAGRSLQLKADAASLAAFEVHRATGAISPASDVRIEAGALRVSNTANEPRVLWISPNRP
jgi:hypothetical protein